MTRILIADQYEVIRVGLRQTLENRSNWEVVAEATDGQEAITKALETKPDVAVLGFSLNILNGIEVTRRILKVLPKTEVLIFTMNDSETLIEEAVRAGARGYVLKSDRGYDLIAAIESLAAHKPFFSSRISEARLKVSLAAKNGSGSCLTNRERCIVQLVAEGNSNKQVANLLEISLKTVESHRSAVMQKLSLSSSAGLVRYAIRNNLVTA